MKKLKLFPKLFLYTIGIMSIIVLLVHGLIYTLLPSFYLEQKREEVSTRANELMAALEKSNELESIDMVERYAIKHNVNITLAVDNNVYRYQGFTPVDIYFDPTSEEFIDTTEISFDYETESGLSELYSVLLEKRNFENKNNQSYKLYLMLSIQPIGEVKQVTFKLLPYSTAVSFIISLIAAYIYSKGITGPIKSILKVTKEMETFKKDSYCIVKSEDEIGMIAENINSLYGTLWNTIESLEEKIDYISEVEREKVEFLRAASHELKTPLTSLHVLLESMKYNIGKYSDRDFYLGQAQEMVMESTKMVQDMLNTSKLQTIELSQAENIDIREILLETIDSYKVLIKSKNINLKLQVEETYHYIMNRSSLKKVISNILSNAINYTEEGKEISIGIKEGNISIENQCTPLSDEVLDNIFKAFYRPDFSRNKKVGGTGLGLYIVKDILDHANLSYSFKPSDLGMKFTIKLKQN